MTENSDGVVLGMFTALDEDLDDIHVFTLEADDTSAFDLTETGELSIKQGMHLLIFS